MLQIKVKSEVLDLIYEPKTKRDKGIMFLRKIKKLHQSHIKEAEKNNIKPPTLNITITKK